NSALVRIGIWLARLRAKNVGLPWCSLCAYYRRHQPDTPVRHIRSGEPKRRRPAPTLIEVWRPWILVRNGSRHRGHVSGSMRHCIRRERGYFLGDQDTSLRSSALMEVVDDLMLVNEVSTVWRATQLLLLICDRARTHRCPIRLIPVFFF